MEDEWEEYYEEDMEKARSYAPREAEVAEAEVAAEVEAQWERPAPAARAEASAHSDEVGSNDGGLDDDVGRLGGIFSDAQMDKQMEELAQTIASGGQLSEAQMQALAKQVELEVELAAMGGGAKAARRGDEASTGGGRAPPAAATASDADEYVYEEYDDAAGHGGGGGVADAAARAAQIAHLEREAEIARKAVMASHAAREAKREAQREKRQAKAKAKPTWLQAKPARDTKPSDEE